MTYITKMARARAAIEAYNASKQQKSETTTGSGNSGSLGTSITIDLSQLIDVNKFETAMRDLGATNDETLAHVSWEDIQQVEKIPKLLAKQLAEIFRSTDNTEDDRPGYVSPRKASKMTYDELFRHYQPEEDNEVSKKLLELSRGKRVVVFDDEAARTINVQASTRLLQEIRRGFPEISVTKTADGRQRSIFKIGEVPNDEVEENPLYPGRPLRSDETCDQTQRSWKGIPRAVRQLVFLATTKTAEAKRLTVDDAHNLMDLCLTPVAEEKLRSRWSAASIMLDDLLAEDRAPRLKLKIGKGASNGDPFYRS